MSVMQSVVQVVGIAVLVLVLVFCLACGLYNAAEWLEDHVKTSFRLIKRATIWCVAVQTSWLLVDRSAVLPNAVGLLSHLSSCLLLKHHPHHQQSMALTAAAVLLLAAHQTTWIYWWYQRRGSVWQAASVLAGLVWPVPTMLLLSSASSEALPLAMNPLPAGAARSAGSFGSAAQSPTAAAAAARGDGVAAVGGSVAGLRRHLVKNAAAALHHYQKPLLPEMDDAQQHRHPDQADQARMLNLMHSSSGVAELQQQLAGQRQHRSMVVRGFDLLKHHIRLMVPVIEPNAAKGSSRGLMGKILKD